MDYEKMRIYSNGFIFYNMFRENALELKLTFVETTLLNKCICHYPENRGLSLECPLTLELCLL